MKVLIVFNHPYEGSYCNAILSSVQRGLIKANHDIDLIYLDKEDFNPVMTSEDLLAFVKKKAVDPKAKEYINRVKAADHLIFIFPIWWELMPALTKGFIDKVVFPGETYDYTESGRGMVNKMNNLKSINVITTMNTPAIAYKLIFGDAIKKVMMTGTFKKMGCKNVKWTSLNMVKFASDQKRKKWLDQLEVKFGYL